MLEVKNNPLIEEDERKKSSENKETRKPKRDPKRQAEALKKNLLRRKLQAGK